MQEHLLKIALKEDDRLARAYVPLGISLNHFRSNGKLLTDEQIAFAKDQLNQENTNALVARRALKNLNHRDPLYAPYDILRITKGNRPHYYAIFYGEKSEKDTNKETLLLGKGGQGKVKLAQDLETGELVALKIPTNKKEIQYETNDANNPIEFQLGKMNFYGKLEERMTREAKFSTQAGSTAHAFTRLNKQKFQTAMIMPLEHGPELYSLYNGEYKYLQKSSSAWLTIALNCCLATQQLHEKKIHHHDIKLNNFMINLLTNNVKLIDFGFASEIVGEDSKFNSRAGTPIYVAPEILQQKSKEIIFNEKSEIYSLGISLALLLGFAEIIPKHDGKEDQIFFGATARSAEKFPDRDLRHRVFGFLQSMAHKDPEQRPKLIDVVDVLKTLKNELDVPSKDVKKIGVFDLKELINATSNKKKESAKEFYAALWACDEVIVVNAALGTEHDIFSKQKSYLELYRELTKRGINVRDNMICAEQPTDYSQTLNIVTSIPNYFDAKENDLKSYFFITQDKDVYKKFSADERICPIFAEQRSKKNSYQHQMQEYQKGQLLTVAQLTNVIDQLTLQETRLNEKYGIDARIGLIDAKCHSLRDIYLNNNDTLKTTLTVEELTTSLTELQKQMRGHSALWNKLAEWLPLHASEAAKQVAKIIETTKETHYDSQRFKPKGP